MTRIFHPFRSFGPLALACLAFIAASPAAVRAQITGPGVYAWGYNYYGQLGNGNTTSSSTPVQVLGVGGSGYLSSVTGVTGGGSHSLALTSTGNVYAWGYNVYGQLGNGTTTDSYTPVQVQGVGGSGNLSNVTAVAGGTYHSLALTSTGNAYAWGYNVYGQLGNGTTTDSYTPVQVQGVGGSGYLSNVTAVAGGVYHSVALTSTGNVYAWGHNGNGQLGNGINTSSSTPVEVLGLGGSGNLSNVTAVAGGENHSLAATSSGNVYAWGWNANGQLGNGNTTDSSTPLLVSLPANGSAQVVAISAGTFDSFALESDGSLWAWGDNSYGQYGNGTTTNSLTPIEVYTPSGGYGISAFAEGEIGYSSLAIVTPVPEPSCLFLLIGIAGLVKMRPRRRARAIVR